MKSLFLVSVLFCLVTLPFSKVSGQEDKSTRPSPPAEAHAKIGDNTISINYSSPSVKGRTIWGDLVPYGKVWRTGANEATIFETSGDLVINGQKLPAGKYGIFTLPGEKEWTIIFNSVWDQWGAFKYDSSKDVLRVKADAEKSEAFNERMKFEIKDHVVSLLWENLRVSFMVK
jgi:Protein of unknown function (DUF2911)